MRKNLQHKKFAMKNNVCIISQCHSNCLHILDSLRSFLISFDNAARIERMQLMSQLILGNTSSAELNECTKNL